MADYTPGHRKTIEAALRKLKLWPDGLDRLPAPISIETGVAGHSQVYLLSLPGKGGHRLGLAAKFETEVARAAIEWKRIAELRTEFHQFRQGLLLPLEGNVQEDGVILFLLAGQDRPFLSSTTILKLIRNLISDAPNSCINALAYGLEPLGLLHRSAEVSKGPAHRAQTWNDVFDSKAHHLNAALGALSLTGIIESANENSVRVRGYEMRNPLSLLASLSEQVIGECRRGRTHGDLNLTNVLCLVDEAQNPYAAYIIDFSHSSSHVPLASDYAKIECELWRNIFFDIDADGDLALHTINTLCYLDGHLKIFPREANSAIVNYLVLLCWWRKKAFENLGSKSAEGAGSLLTDYLHCLFFHSVRTLSREDVVANHQKTLVVWLVAAHVAQTLQEISKGRYSHGATSQLSMPPKKIVLDHPVWPERIPSLSSRQSPKKIRGSTDPYDRRLFVRRRQLDRAIADLERSIPVLVIGCQGAGKTWSLKHIADTAAQPVVGRRVIDIDMRLYPLGGASNHRHLCEWLMAEISRRLNLETVPLQPGTGDANETATLIAMRELAGRFTGDQLYLLLDNADSLVVRSFKETAGHFYRQMAAWRPAFESQGKRLSLVFCSAKDLDHIEGIIGLSIFHATSKCRLTDFEEPQVREAAAASGVILSVDELAQLFRLTGGRPAHVAGVIGDILSGELKLDGDVTPLRVPFFANTLQPELLRFTRDTATSDSLRKIDSGRTDLVEIEMIHDLEMAGLVQVRGRSLKISNDFVRAMLANG